MSRKTIKIKVGKQDPRMRILNVTSNYSDTRDKSIKSPLPQEASFSLGIYGGCGYGKTNVLRSLLMNSKQFKEKFDLIFYVAPNHDPWAEKNISPKRLFRSITPELVEEIKTQSAAQMEQRKNSVIKSFIEQNFSDDEIFEIIKYKKNGGSLPPSIEDHLTVIQPDCKVLLILDDMISDIKKASRELDEFYLRRRHTGGENVGLSVITVSQVYNRIPLQYRKNIDYHLIFEPKNEKERNSIMEEILSGHDPRVLDLIFKNKSSDGLCHDFLFVDKLGKLYLNFAPIKIEY